jgi:hypothetical protein
MFTIELYQIEKANNFSWTWFARFKSKVKKQPRKCKICKHKLGNSKPQRTQTSKSIEETTLDCWLDNTPKRLWQNLVVGKLEAMRVGNLKLSFFSIMTCVFNMSSSGGP